jgi:enoyl-CoA hydratase/carnithine racemase
LNYLWETATLDEFQRRVLDYAHALTPPHKASLAVGRIKRAVQAAAELPIDQGLAIERELQAELFASHDAREGLEAYCAKRAPAFRGR